jgi:hypothetical protein
MHPSLFLRFWGRFFGDFMKTVKDDKMSWAAIPATLVWFLVNRKDVKLDIWTIIGPLVFGASFVVCQHALSAARSVVRDIKTEPIEERRSPILDRWGDEVVVSGSDQSPPYYELRLYGIFVIVLFVCLTACVLSVDKYRIATKEEPNTITPIAPISVSLLMACNWSHLPIHIPEASTAHILKVHPGLLKLNPNFNSGLFEDITSADDKALDWPSNGDGKWMNFKEMQNLMIKDHVLADSLVDNCTLRSYTNGTLEDIAPTLLVDTPDKKRHFYPIPFDPLISGTSFSFYVVNMCTRGTLPDLVQWDDFAKVRVLGENKVRRVPLNFQKRSWPPNGLMIGEASSFVWNGIGSCQWGN